MPLFFLCIQLNHRILWARGDLQGSPSPTPVIFVCFLNEKKDIWMGALVLCSSSVSNTQNEWAPLKKPFISNAMHCLRKEFQSTAFKQSEQKLRCLRTAFTWYESRELPIGFRASLLIYRSRVLTNEQKTLLGGLWSEVPHVVHLRHGKFRLFWSVATI